ncbi:MAG TPA: amidase family protein [Pseudonocardia sp.]|uniref:amidase n=1 Tax=Pseudonocardia sp. TaxID=60912 RepID=UPI002C1B48A7|nr:amidase family protein [Pseudonocardia sp.]HTF51241.1 amidase family protein [Pseudonocardia sp.]
MELIEYAAHDATGLAHLIRTRQVSAQEVHETARRAIAAVHQRLNAVVSGPWEVPLEHRAGGRFGGVPFVVKDIVCHAAGVATYYGTRALPKGLTYSHDTELMARFKAAGLATLATTTTPELANSAATVSELTGTTHNPWRVGATPGGSSGGSAVLVAAGAVPLAHANDGGGSIRIPAARTGLVGLKPSRGRVPLGPDQQELMSGNAVEFAVTRSVRDAAALLDAVAGPAPGERYTAPPPRRPYVCDLDGVARPLRVAVCTRSWSGVAVESTVSSAVSSTARTVEGLGHVVDEAYPDVDWDELIHAFNIIWCLGTSAAVSALAEAGGVPIDESHFEHTTLLSYRHGLTLGALDLAAAFASMNTVSRTVAEFMAQWDVLMAPTANQVTLPVNYLDRDGQPETSEEWVRRILADYPLCPLYNVTGAPAVSVPSATDPDGLPIGVHLGGGLYGESELIGLAAQLEAELPWYGRQPAVHVSRW